MKNLFPSMDKFLERLMYALDTAYTARLIFKAEKMEKSKYLPVIERDAFEMLAVLIPRCLSHFSETNQSAFGFVQKHFSILNSQVSGKCT